MLGMNCTAVERNSNKGILLTTYLLCLLQLEFAGQWETIYKMTVFLIKDLMYTSIGLNFVYNWCNMLPTFGNTLAYYWVFSMHL